MNDIAELEREESPNAMNAIAKGVRHWTGLDPLLSARSAKTKRRQRQELPSCANGNWPRTVWLMRRWKNGCALIRQKQQAQAVPQRDRNWPSHHAPH